MTLEAQAVYTRVHPTTNSSSRAKLQFPGI